MKNNCFLFERLFKVKKGGVFLFGISFFVLEIFAFLYYDMVDAMNSLIRDCIDRHASLRRTKVTRPQHPGLQTDEIRLLQSERDHLRKLAHENGSETSWNVFREVRDKIKRVVNKARRSFLSKALFSKRPKEVWKVIHRILNPSPKPLRENPDELNR